MICEIGLDNYFRRMKIINGKKNEVIVMKLKEGLVN